MTDRRALLADYMRAYYWRNRATILARQTLWRAAHRESERARVAAYRAARKGGQP